jgi:LuxR family maltose regulon positive regulatory protein
MPVVVARAGQAERRSDDLARRRELAGDSHQRNGRPAPPSPVVRLIEPLSTTEIRVLQYLPTHLTMAQIADELYVSLNTIRTHMRHLYTKLGTHQRADTVERARALGLLASTRPPSRQGIISPSGSHGGLGGNHGSGRPARDEPGDT